jgi:hypothetical protein
MRRHLWKSSALAVVALALTAVGPSAVFAQDHHDDHRDDHPAEHRDEHPELRHDEKHDDHRADPAIKYRHDHPGKSARCHDGFFTSTHDRNHACTKHGGIDVWLVL